MIIYLLFYFSGHWCSGVMKIDREHVTYWNDGAYVTESIIKSDTIKSETFIRTPSKVIVISSGRIKYFVKNKQITLWKKKL